ncbi:uncharacterized protein LOC132473424 isoform X3 [Gadus macrocephalus]|uniref:uncharacterized protein LOC132473424 isoform X3 n=1 Tax=Gadus macrocephalus TaxID=80720 RepID=UPI0028CBB362|nr:uncharacterized protein LOC132473424 isoform X3 [Gadus macrocephalus]
MECAASIMMAVGYILRLSWICLLLFGGSLPFPSMKWYKYTSTDHPEAMAGDIKLANYPTGMLDLYSLVDRSNKIPLGAALKQAPLNPEEGARFQGGGALELGQENAKIEDWNHVRPVTFPLRPPYQHNSFEEQWGSRKPMFPSAYEPSTKPSSELAGSDLIPPTSYLFYDAFSSDPTLESKQGSESGVYFNPTQNLNFQAGEREGSQIWRRTGGEEPGFSNMGQAAPTIGAQTLQADTVSSSDTNGGYYSSALQLDVQAGSQSYSPNLVYEDVFYYPDAETAPPSKEGDRYDSANAVQPSTLSSASYMTKEEQPVFSSHTGDWAHVAPVETPAYPSFVADFGLDSTSSKTAAQPVLFAPQLPSSKWLQRPKKAPQLSSSKWLQRPKKARDQTASTYIVQSKGSHRRSRQMLSKKKYFSGFPPPPPFVLMALRP